MTESPINTWLEQLARDLRNSPALKVAEQAATVVSDWQLQTAAKAAEMQRQFAASPAAAWLTETIRLSEETTARVADVQRQVAASPAAAWMSEMARWSDETARTANRWLADLNARYPNWPEYVAQVAENARTMARRGLAPNWKDLDGDELEAMVLLMNEAEVNLAWAPGAEILRVLIAAGPAGVDGVLAARSSDIVAELQTVLDDVQALELMAAANAARQALDAHAAGMPLPAQAMATVLVAVIVEDLHGLGGIVKAHNTYKKLDPEKAAFDEFRRIAIRRCLSFACAGTNAPGTNFHRNRSAHHVDPAQYTPANVVRALLLVVGLLREEQFWIDEDALRQAA
jgi:hypothetical protein